MADQHAVPILGRLETVPIRCVWSSEPYAFDPWLSQPANLQFLADSLGLPGLELLQAQSPVGPFAADLICKVVGTDHKVVIENQLDKADHRHLGQVLTYAPHHDAKVCVWVAAEICDEHRAAVDWLNRISNDDFAFFAVEVTAVRIGDSMPAPLFEVVARPNDFSKLAPESVSSAPSSSNAASNIGFWRMLHGKLKVNFGPIRKYDNDLKDTNYWAPIVPEANAFIVAYRSQSVNPCVGTYIGFYAPNGGQVWQYLQALQPQLNAKYEEPLRWVADRSGTSFKITTDPHYGSPDPTNWEGQTDLLVGRMKKLKDVFEETIRSALTNFPET
jgi:hypothetical protein